MELHAVPNQKQVGLTLSIKIAGRTGKLTADAVVSEIESIARDYADLRIAVVVDPSAENDPIPSSHDAGVHRDQKK